MSSAASREHSNPSSSTLAAQADAFDLSPLEESISESLARLRNDLSQLRSGGRFNPSVLDNLKVAMPVSSSATPSASGGAGGGESGGGGKGSSKAAPTSNTQRIPLSDLAQIIPKGRQIHVQVSEQSYVKTVSSAINAANLNLNVAAPSASSGGQENDPLLLVLNVPPPTAESRKAVLDEAKKMGDVTLESVRDARQATQKRFKGDKKARPDELRKALERMEKACDGAKGEVKKIVDGARRVLDS